MILFVTNITNRKFIANRMYIEVPIMIPKILKKITDDD